MNEPVEFLDLDDVVGLAIALLGDPAPIRDIGLLGSAVARPQTTAFGVDAYPEIWTKAAALLHSIVKNHALVDGNKRLGWLATAVFLEINGVEISRASNDDVYDLVIDVAAGQPTVDTIAERLRQLAQIHLSQAGLGVRLTQAEHCTLPSGGHRSHRRTERLNGSWLRLWLGPDGPERPIGSAALGARKDIAR